MRSSVQGRVIGNDGLERDGRMLSGPARLRGAMETDQNAFE